RDPKRGRSACQGFPCDALRKDREKAAGAVKATKTITGMIKYTGTITGTTKGSCQRIQSMLSYNQM
ncbi:hypothetical protein, partial [Jutongia sp.]